jgi:hypothetical protein
LSEINDCSAARAEILAEEKPMSGSPLTLVLLWHMHQPDYRDHASGEFLLPWVYLHALKDCSDMAWHLENQSGVRAVVNLTPALLEQLDDYAEQFAKGRCEIRCYGCWRGLPGRRYPAPNASSCSHAPSRPSTTTWRRLRLLSMPCAPSRRRRLAGCRRAASPLGPVFRPPGAHRGGRERDRAAVCAPCSFPSRGDLHNAVSPPARAFDA